MLEGFTPWPPEFAARYRAAGLWEGRTLCQMLAATAARLPAKVAVVDGRWATVGSSNIDPYSLLMSREANILMWSPCPDLCVPVT